MGIMWLFQIPVDGWLTKLSSPIVRYDPEHFSGIRVFFDSPLEDFGFAYALVTLSIVLWLRQDRAVAEATPGDATEAQLQEVGDG